LSPIEQAKAYYQSKGWSFEQDLGFYLCHGYVFSTPDRLLLAKPVRKEIGEADWHPSQPDCWYVHYAAGKGKPPSSCPISVGLVTRGTIASSGLIPLG
jgi:hypothetical protein